MTITKDSNEANLFDGRGTRAAAIDDFNFGSRLIYAELAEIPFLSVICTMWYARSLPLAQYSGLTCTCAAHD